MTHLRMQLDMRDLAGDTDTRVRLERCMMRIVPWTDMNISAVDGRVLWTYDGPLLRLYWRPTFEGHQN